MAKYVVWIALLGLISCNSSEEEDRIQPTRTDITELVYASATVKPEQAYLPQPGRAGIIREILVEEGDSVQAGQVLARITTTADVQNGLTNAEINLREARENYLGENNVLRNIELELEALRKQLTLDSLNYSRQKKLWEQNIGKKAELERMELAYTLSRNQYERARQRKAQTVLELENQYERAQSRVQAEQTQLSDFTLRSVHAGMVYAINKEVGEFISSQDFLAEIGSSTAFVVEMDIDEEDITKISLGDTVFITLNAYANAVFRANVSKIYYKKDELTQTFRVECLFADRPPKLYYGLSGEANILVDKRANALVIPSEYLLQGNKVLTSEGEVDVVTGVKTMQQVEILSGIDTSAFLLKPTGL